MEYIHIFLCDDAGKKLLGKHTVTPTKLLNYNGVLLKFHGVAISTLGWSDTGHTSGEALISTLKEKGTYTFIHFSKRHWSFYTVTLVYQNTDNLPDEKKYSPSSFLLNRLGKRIPTYVLNMNYVSHLKVFFMPFLGAIKEHMLLNSLELVLITPTKTRGLFHVDIVGRNRGEHLKNTYYISLGVFIIHRGIIEKYS